MKIFPHIQTLGAALLAYDTLVISDLHLGHEASLVTQGVMVPPIQTKEVLQQLKQYVKLPFTKVVLNGDLKHDFGRILDSEWRDVLKVLDLFLDKEVFIVKGNHDVTLAPIAKKRGIKLVDSYQTHDVLIMHGDSILRIPSEVRTIVLGHERYCCMRARHLISISVFLLESTNIKRLLLCQRLACLHQERMFYREHE